jgi:hypothetical protein
MSYFNREAIVVERRQPILHWSAIFGGAAISVGVWVVLQVWGVGIGMRSLDAANPEAFHRITVFSGVWSLIAPIVAAFIGSIFAGWLAHTRERGVGAAHGFIVWALASLLGALVTLSLAPMLEPGNATGADQVRVAHRIGGALMWIGGSMIVSLAAALVGGALGVRRRDGTATPPNERVVTTVPPRDERVVTTVPRTPDL